MKAQQRNPYKLCYICKVNQIRKMCLAQEIINAGKYLFCDNCRKDKLLQNHKLSIFQIDSYSGPVSLFSINATQHQTGKQINQAVEQLKQSIEKNAAIIYNNYSGIQQHTISRILQLVGTFNSQNAQNLENLLKRHDQTQVPQVLQKIKRLKWFQENKRLIEDTDNLKQKIINYIKSFNEKISYLSVQIQKLVGQFIGQFDTKDFFNQKKKYEKQLIKNKQPIKVNKKIKQNDKPQIKQSIFKNNQMIMKELPRYQKINEQKKQSKQSQRQKMSEQNNEQINKINPKIIKIPNNNNNKQVSFKKLSQSVLGLNVNLNVKQDPNPNLQVIQPQLQKQPSSSQIKPNIVIQQKIKKKRSTKQIQKPNKQAQIVQQPKPRLVLQKVSTKDDYLQQQKLIINLKNVAQIFYVLNNKIQNNRSTGTAQPQIKYQQYEGKIAQQHKHRINYNQDKLKPINLDKIKYLEVQQLPKRQQQMFTLLIRNKQVKVLYSLSKLYEKIEQMQNLQQIHIFTSYLFPSQQNILTILLSPNLKVLTFSCFNNFSKILSQYKQVIGDHFNQQMKVLSVSGNIPYHQNLQLSDLKLYYPESDKDKKIFDEHFSKNYQTCIKSQINRQIGQINEKQIIQNKNFCWFDPRDTKLVDKQRVSNILKPEQSILLIKSFKQLRNCWIPYLSEQILQNHQLLINFQKIEYLSLGYHSFLLQNIPQNFYFTDKIFTKSLYNLKSLNLINLNIYEFLMKKLLSKQTDLLTLKIQNCIGLTNQFYKNLSKLVPKLKKLSINNLKSGIDGDFIIKFENLQTLILPWSQLVYKQQVQEPIIQQKEWNNHQIEEQTKQKPQKMIEQNDKIQRKWKYINLYGCKWFSTEFFLLADLKQIRHLNIGKCSNVDTQILTYYLAQCENLQSLCLDQIPLTNDELFNILSHLPKLTRLSVAYCPNLNFSEAIIKPQQIMMLDRMSHLDVRNNIHLIPPQVTTKLVNPKFMIISRSFQLQQNQSFILNRNQIYAFSTSN